MFYYKFKQKVMKKLFLISILFLFFAQFSFAQEDKGGFSVDVGGDVVSRYLWRGLQFGESMPALQPYIEFGAGPIVFGFLGSTGLSGRDSFQEFDFYVGANFMDDMVSILINDYYFPDYSNNYFDYHGATTGHLFELNLSFNGTENIPFTFLAGMNFFGADALKIDDDPNSVHFNDDVRIKYSTYIEFGYHKSFGNVEFAPFLGFNLTDAKDPNPNTGYVGETGYYSNDRGLIHAGFKVSKDIEITDKFTLPIYGQVSTNYQSRQVFWVLGVSF
jgi:hypothetical protein